MSDNTVVRSPADYGKYAVAAALLIGGLVFFYMSKQADWIRGVVVVAGVIAGAAVYMTSTAGKNLMQFFRAAYAEMLRVVWPTQRETLQMTLVVFGFVIVMAIFLWISDKVIEWTLVDLVLGWRK